MYTLTKKQSELLEFIKAFQIESGTSPSLEEMRVGLGFNSKSAIHRRLQSLEERGAIKRLRYRARAIEIQKG